MSVKELDVLSINLISSPHDSADVPLQLKGRIGPFAVSADAQMRLPRRGSSGELRAGNETGSGLRRQGPSRQVRPWYQPPNAAELLPLFGSCLRPPITCIHAEEYPL
jgi:hypothetical protein